jgi:hypothetical protein
MKTTRTTYRATLCNPAGELDMISADDLETLARHLGKRLVSQTWLLADGDVIVISSGEVPR